MSYITNILFWISTGMLLPVIILLLISFIFSLISLGEIYGGFVQRIRNRKKMQQLEKDVRQKGIISLTENNILKNNTLFSNTLCEMKKNNFSKAICEKILNDFIAEKSRICGKSIILTRTGPMLGLMGTLIPMGPALTGLASGDIASMAANMQVAFATTVIGIFTGGCGFLTSFLSERWYSEDYDLLEYIAETAFSENNGENDNEKK